MFRLIRGLLALALLGGVVYVAVTVPLGQKTLWGHIRAIAGSEESQELVRGVKDKAGELVPRTDGGRSGDELTPKERELLRKLIRDKLGRPKAEK